MIKETYPYTVIIDDGLSKYQYTFNLKKEVSIYDIASTISNKYNVNTPSGMCIDSKNRLQNDKCMFI